MNVLIFTLLGIGAILGSTVWECYKILRHHEKRMNQLEKEHKQAKEYYKRLGNG